MQPYRKFTNASSGGVPGLSNAAGGTAIADNKVIRGDGTTGIQGSVVDLSDAGNLTGPSGGMSLTGGTASGDDITLVSTSHATKGDIILDGTVIANVDNGTDGGTLRIQRKDITTSALLLSARQVGTSKSTIDTASGELQLSSNGGNDWVYVNSLGLKIRTAASNATTYLYVPANDVIRVSDSAGTGFGFLQTAGFKRKTADQTVTDSTTYVDDTHLTIPLAAGRSYKFRFHLFCTVVATSQIKVRLGGTATHTDLISDIRVFDPAVPVYDGASIVDSTTVADHTMSSSALSPGGIITIEGTTTVNAAGTFLVQFAQDAETVAAESAILLRGSTLEVWDIA